MRNLIISILLYSFAGYANALDCNSILSKSDIEQFSGEEAALPRKQPAPDDDTCHMNIRVFVPGASYNTSYAYYWSKMGESDAKSIYEEEKNWEPKDAIKMLADLGTSAYWIEHEKNNHSIRIHIPSGYLKVSCNFGRSDGYCNKDKVVDLARIALAHAKGETISVVKKEPVTKEINSTINCDTILTSADIDKACGFTSQKKTLPFGNAKGSCNFRFVNKGKNALSGDVIFIASPFSQSSSAKGALSMQQKEITSGTYKNLYKNYRIVEHIGDQAFYALHNIKPPVRNLSFYKNNTLIELKSAAAAGKSTPVCSETGLEVIAKKVAGKL